jgi:hypothetical protein
MMLSYLATATLAVGLLATAPKPLEWEQSYGKALEATRAGQDPLLVVLDKPRTEDARIEPELISEDETSGSEFKLLQPYRLCRVDVSTDYGKRVAKAFHAKTFPHVAIIDKTGSVVLYHKSGKIKANEWQQVLTRHKSGERPAVSRVTYKRPSTSSSSRSYCPNCQRSQF